MTQPILLSILIPTVVGRESELKRLLTNIHTQAGKYYDPRTVKKGEQLVEVREYCDNKEITIGEKREELYKCAHGLYSWQIDDDDDIAPNAIELILEAIRSSPDVDCITFEEHIDIDGKIQRSNHSLKYADWANGTDGFDYVRTPFMKSVIKTEIAKSVPIPHIRFGEDHQWAQALKPHLKTEIHIDEQIYKYIHRSSDFNERYGIVEKRNENSEPTNY